MIVPTLLNIAVYQLPGESRETTDYGTIQHT